MKVFIMQRLSAIALVIFMTIHMIVVHYPPFHIDFSIILQRLENPVWKVIDILFLFFVLIHALAGVYAVLTDYEFVSKYKKILAAVAFIAGIGAFVWGTITIWHFHPPL
jgi:succinate dehydrogenase hydrophobic membrane anchor protein